MRFLLRVWEDIKKGENVDLYVTVIIAIGLVILNLLGVANQTGIGPLNLVVLSLLAISILGNRYKVEEVLKNVTQTPESQFLEGYPASLGTDMEKARELWLIGFTLSRTIKTYYSLLEKKLAKGDRIKVLLVHPHKTACEIAGMREYGRFDLTRTQVQIQGVLDDFCELRRIAPEKLEIRVVNYPLGFGGFAINPEAGSGVLYLEHYPFKAPGGSIPKFVLHAHDGHLYELFKTEMQMLWQNGEVWNCDRSE